MKVFVTGGSGFIGKHCVALLKQRGHEVIAPSSKEIDIRKPFSFKEHVDALVHLAAYNITSVGLQDKEMFQSVNVEGTRNVLQGVPCGRVVFLSTLKVHDHNPGLYAQSKVLAEQEARQWANGRELAIIRCANVLGRGQAPKAVLPVLIARAKEGKPLCLTANPLTPLHYLDVRDLAQIIVKAVEVPAPAGVFNAAYPDTVTLQEMALKVIAACRSSSTIESTVDAEPLAAAPVDCSATWDRLGCLPRFNIDQTIEDILA